MVEGVCRTAFGACPVTRWYISLTLPPQFRAAHKKACKATRKARQGVEGLVVLHGTEIELETEAPPPVRVEACDHCSKEGLELLVCLGCHQARYCSAACQKDAWLVCYLIFSIFCIFHRSFFMVLLYLFNVFFLSQHTGIFLKKSNINFGFFFLLFAAYF